MSLGSNHFGALAALAVAVTLCGCAGGDDASSWFPKRINLLADKGGYTYADLSEARHDRRITANDLVDANGGCPPAASNPAAAAGSSPGEASLFGGGIGIGMSECDVVLRVGPPGAVDLGRSANGDRTAMLTYKSGPRPGIYRFVGGRLTEMDRVDEPPPPPEPVKKKKKAVKAKNPPKSSDGT